MTALAGLKFAGQSIEGVAMKRILITGFLLFLISVAFAGNYQTVGPVADKAGQVYNVVAYGAAGDGVEDDTAEVQAAHTAATVSGGIVFFPTGTYKITSSTTFNSDVTAAFSNGAKLSIQTGVTFTLNGPVDAGLYQIFSWAGTGTVAGLQYASPEWFGAVAGDATGDYDEIVKAMAAVTGDYDEGKGLVIFAKGVYKLESTLTPNIGITFRGQGKLDSIIWYSGTGTAITATGSHFSMEGIHLTALDPGTTGWPTDGTAGTGGGTIGVDFSNQFFRLSECMFTYFNNATNKAVAVKATGSAPNVCEIEHSLIRWCWGGIELVTAANDCTIEEVTILDVKKFGISTGYNWTSAAQGSQSDNVRIHNCVIENINKTPHTPTGDGYAIYLFRAAVPSIIGTYIEDYWAPSGATAYGIYAAGNSDGDVLGLNIIGCNVVSACIYTTYSVYADYVWYGNIYGNMFDGGNGSVTLSSHSDYIAAGPNYFIGAPSDPYSVSGSYHWIYDIENTRIITPTQITYEGNAYYKGIVRAEEFRLNDDADDHYVQILVDENLSNNRTLNLKLNNGTRTVTIEGDGVIHEELSGSTTWDPGSIADGDEEAKEVTATGAVLGDFAIASFSLDVSDLVLDAQVTAANTVTCILANNTGGAVDLGSGTVKVRVIK